MIEFRVQSCLVGGHYLK